ncbi:MAG: class IV adenylate cyclase [Minisyncoccia bacterium]
MSSTNEEIEVIFLDIYKDVIEKKLIEIGAKKVKDIFYRHASFDYPDYRLNKDNSWIRLRDEDGEVVLAYKKRFGVTSQDGSTNDAGMEEIEFTVGSYENTKTFLGKVGFVEKHEAEKKRTRWVKGSTVFDIDTWPELPTFLEIEAESWEDISTAEKELDLEEKNRKICSVNQIYKMHGMDVDDYLKISFDGMIKKLDVQKE